MSNINSNITSVFHKEIIPDTQILSSFCGKFIPILANSYFDTITETKIDQICCQYSTKIKIYAISKSKNTNEFNKLHLLNTYSIFDKIISAEKFNSLSSKNKSLNSIILSLSSYKISIIEYDILYDSFNTIALYSIDKFILSGLLKIEQSFKIMSSLTYNYITFIFDNDKLCFLRKKPEKKILEENKEKKQKTKLHAYSDTIGGNNYFFPSIYLNDLNTKYNIYKIINIYIPNKNSELFNFENGDIDDKKENEKIHIYILYIESKSDTFNSPEIKTEQNIIFNSFMRNKINVGLLSYNLKNNEYIDFKILFTAVDENAFDFTILENEDPKETTAIIFSAYNLQIIDLKKKISINYITNIDYYNLIFSKLYTDNNKYKVICKNFDSNDLRGGGYLVIDSNDFFFTDSQGKIFFVEYKNIENIRFESIIVNTENNYLDSPYNKILLPYGYIFFLSSPFSDAILLFFDQEKKYYQIKDRIKNYSPIINFHLVNDDLSNEIKFVFTHGYGKNSFISFAYRNLLFYQIKSSSEMLDNIDLMKTVKNSADNFTKFILCKLESKKLIIFQSINNDLINVSNQVDYNKDSNIINFGEIYINTDDNNISNEKLIVLIFENEIKFYNQNFALISTFNNNFLENKSAINITNVKLSENLCLIYNTQEKRYFLWALYFNKLPNNNNINEIILGQNLFFRYKELTPYITNNKNDFIELNMLSKMYLNKYIFLMLYRNNMILEIYDLTEFLKYKDNMIIENDSNENNNNLKLLLKSELINYTPPIIFNDNLDKNNLYRSDSNINLDFLNSINDLFNPNDTSMENLQKSNSQEIALKSSVSFSIDSPNFIYFGNLGNLIILALTLKSEALILYKLYIAEMTEDFSDIKKIGFKKIFMEKLSEINYRELFLKNIDNLFIPFENINNQSGILFNLENNMKILYEVNGEISLLNNKITKSSWGSFCDYNDFYCKNGFIAYEGSSLKFCILNSNYTLSNNSLLIRTNQIKRFPSILTYTPEYTNTQLIYNYISVEKEMISPDQFQYFLSLRKEEDPKPIIELKFDTNEIITECTVIELQKSLGNSNTNKYIALGVINITDDENLIKSKIKLYEYIKDNNNNYKFEFEMEKDGFKGVITLMQSLNNLSNLYNLILIGEGQKLNIYQFKLNEQFKFNLENINFSFADNKNLSLSHKLININKNKLLLTGDIVDSFSFFYIKSNMNINMANQTLDVHLESKDNNHIHVTAVDFWNINNKKMCIILDEEKNGYIYSLENNNIRICDFHINKTINEIRTRGQSDNNRSPSFYSSTNGSIGLFQHIDNDIYEKLNYLCEFIYFHFPFNSGVNPSLFYSINYVNDNNNNFERPKGRFIDKNILDIFLKLSDKFQDFICNNVLEINKNELIQIITNLIYI